MEILTFCAQHFHNYLMTREPENLTEDQKFEQALGKEVVVFNMATLAIVSVVALGILGVLGLRAVVVLGGVALAQRFVAQEAFNTQIKDISRRATDRARERMRQELPPGQGWFERAAVKFTGWLVGKALTGVTEGLLAEFERTSLTYRGHVILYGDFNQQAQPVPAPAAAGQRGHQRR